jgi:hypothetical protein
MSILRKNSAKSRKTIESFPKLYVNKSERCVLCFKILEHKGSILFEGKNVLMIASYWKKLSEFYSLFYNLLPKYIFIN